MNAKNYKLISGLVVLLIALSVAGYFVSKKTADNGAVDGNGTSDDNGEIDNKNDLIRVASPSPGETIESPLIIQGEAIGTWYFEATFPIVLVDWDGLIIAEGYAQALDEWMTPEFVPFEATLEFDAPSYGETGTLILQKSNPSGLPEHDDSFEVPIKFEPKVADNDPDRQRDVCVITGCSGQVCAEEEVITTCEYFPEYECYKTAVCARQSGGECGWTMTEELGVCIEGSK